MSRKRHLNLGYNWFWFILYCSFFLFDDLYLVDLVQKQHHWIGHNYFKASEFTSRCYIRTNEGKTERRKKKDADVTYVDKRG